MAQRATFASILLFALIPTLVSQARADVAPLISGSARPLLASAGTTSRIGSASLFAGPETGIFAPLPPRATSPAPPRAGTSVAGLLDLIAQAEAGPAGHDAVQHGARIPPPRPPTAMTLGEIEAWTRATPGQPHAIGRYQFIPATLRRVAALRGYGPETRFSPEVQDALAMVLLEEAGLTDFLGGRLDRHDFMHNLARIWAGLPLPDGRSYYHGHAGNRATMSWEAFEAGMARIGPAS